jgi:hypothetical protein
MKLSVYFLMRDSLCDLTEVFSIGGWENMGEAVFLEEARGPSRSASDGAVSDDCSVLVSDFADTAR